MSNRSSIVSIVKDFMANFSGMIEDFKISFAIKAVEDAAVKLKIAAMGFCESLEAIESPESRTFSSASEAATKSKSSNSIS